MVENKLINGYEPALIRLYGARDSVEITEQMAVALCGDRILALGREALQLAQDPVAEQMEKLVEIVSPLKDGVVANYELAAKVFRYFVRKCCRRHLFFKPRIAVCVPLTLTKVERKVYEDVFYQVGAKKVLVVESAMDQAMAGLPAEYGMVVGIFPQPRNGR
ncbi:MULTISPECIES: rod shape-determining protein [Enterocloster]|uniref:MreB/Mbl protein n=1 Tax=Enterocloster lavalensis TaxID=460384 RepID=A0A1I0GBP7_9FIRM|nr:MULTISPECIES: rod shape-determining protein [Enterocloster]MDR3757466.1 rod shape-determining protein [Enterocloster sp.]SET68154.1 MreB/Mbl protein [Enterocloster lavalensis]